MHDGDTDVFICNDVQENFLFRNDGRGRFEEVASLTGMAFDAEGEILANMAVDCGDFDRDGWLDFYTTNYQNQLPDAVPQPRKRLSGGRGPANQRRRRRVSSTSTGAAASPISTTTATWTCTSPTATPRTRSSNSA